MRQDRPRHPHRSGSEVEKLTHAAEFFVAAVDELAGRLIGEDEQLALEDIPQQFRCAVVVGMRSTVRFGDNFVDDAKFLEVVGHDLHGDGSGFRLGGVAPDDRRAAFGRNHGIKAVLENVDAIADGDRQCAAGTTLAGYGDDYRHGQARHLAKIAGDGLALTALLRVDARVSTRRIHEGENGSAELSGELHDAKRFAITLGLRLAEIANHTLLGVLPLLRTDDRHGTAAEFSETGDQGFVVAETTVPVELDEIADHQIDPVESIGPLRMPRDLGPLPRTQVRVKLPAKLEDLTFQSLEFRVAFLTVSTETAQFLDVFLEALDLFLTIDSVRGLAVFPCSAHYEIL